MKFNFSTEQNKFSMNANSEIQSEVYEFADEIFSTNFEFEKISYSPKGIKVVFQKNK